MRKILRNQYVVNDVQEGTGVNCSCSERPVVNRDSIVTNSSGVSLPLSQVRRSDGSLLSVAEVLYGPVVNAAPLDTPASIHFNYTDGPLALSGGAKATARNERGKAEGSNADAQGSGSARLRAGRADPSLRDKYGDPSLVPYDEQEAYWNPKGTYRSISEVMGEHEGFDEAARRTYEQIQQGYADDHYYPALSVDDSLVSEDRRSRTATLRRNQRNEFSGNASDYYRDKLLIAPTLNYREISEEIGREYRKGEY